MTASEKFSLKWNDFQENISIAFSSLRTYNHFSDVTLVSDDGQKIEAHKAILSASSPFFMDFFNLSKHPHPLIYLKGYKEKQLNSILDFIYHGVADIYQDDLEEFLVIAEGLKLKGLTGGLEEFHGKDIPKNSNQKLASQPPRKEERQDNNEFSLTAKNEYYSSDISSAQEHDQKEITTVIATNNHEPKVYYTGGTVKDLRSTLWSMISKNGTILTCNVCGKTIDKAVSKNGNQHMEKHVENIHVDGVTYECSKCDKTFRSRNALHKHTNTNHNINQ